MTTTQKRAESAATSAAKSPATYDGFTDEERGAMKARAQELKTSARRGSRADKAAEEEAAVVAKIAEMRESDRVMAERIHAVIKESVPELAPKLWYGMPSYAKDGKVVCFFQSAQKFSARYATFGFSDKANLDEGAMWPASYALTELTPEGEARIADLVRRAVR
ncbi:iron chaperone [Streptomyces sp. SYP-A7185]|uniref:iron chaperone n=1 Tax=Streptomyces sp. SYP-A7185 TaxID=3040076 RepID=UPI0038F77192